MAISLFEQAKMSVESLLKTKGFPTEEKVMDGVLGLINQIADYYEEGVKLYPEVVMVGDIQLLDMLPNRRLTLYDKSVEADEFKRMMKLCSPLATDNWCIYVCLCSDNMQYGVLSAEIEETSLSLSKQLIQVADKEDPIIYIRNVGSKNVELSAPGMEEDNTLVISLTLDEYTHDYDDNLNGLVNAIIADCEESDKNIIQPFMVKLLKDALNEGHGNLIVVCKKEVLNAVIEGNMSGGACLTPAIDIPYLLRADARDKSSRTSVNIKSNVSVIKSMINHDGITIFSTDGCLLAYHYIVSNALVQKIQTVGGSRSKAFAALEQIDDITARFFKSQDGITKFA